MGVLIVFEGIDGSGKTTLSNRVTKRLREEGLSVEHVREGGEFTSKVTHAIRELGRDARHLALTPRAELHLLLARDVQQYEETIRPALARADVVIADRFFETTRVLGCEGRGLGVADVDVQVAAAARGARADLVVLVDVEPYLARARRKVAKIEQPRLPSSKRSSSRKGLAGVGLQIRMRKGYLRLAAEDPARWLVIDNSEASMESLVDTVSRAIRAVASGNRLVTSSLTALHHTSAPTTPEEALSSFLAWVGARTESEPALAAYLLGGLGGAAADDMRLALCSKAPRALAFTLKGRIDETAMQLRHLLKETAPHEVAHSLVAAGDSQEAYALREALIQRAPDQAARSLSGLSDERAWELRNRLCASVSEDVLISLAGLGDERAWKLREHLLPASLNTHSEARLAVLSVAGLDDERAWALRDAALAEAPLDVLESLVGLANEKAFSLRERFVFQAPKVVLETLDGLSTEPAWALRAAYAPLCKEALDSIIGLDEQQAWDLREQYANIWPSTVAKSLGTLASTPRGRALLMQLLAAHPHDHSLQANAAMVVAGGVVMRKVGALYFALRILPK